MQGKYLIFLLFFCIFFTPTQGHAAAPSSHTMGVALTQLHKAQKDYESANTSLRELEQAYETAVPTNAHKKLQTSSAAALEAMNAALAQALAENTYLELGKSGSFDLVSPLPAFAGAASCGPSHTDASAAGACADPAYTREYTAPESLRIAQETAEATKQAYQKASNALEQLQASYDNTSSPTATCLKLKTARDAALKKWVKAQKNYLAEYALHIRQVRKKE